MKPKAKTSAFTGRVHHVIASNGLLKKGSTVVVGVSGGPDSVALLHALWQLKYQLGIKIIVGHFNYRLRLQAGGDEKFVVLLAQKFGIPVFCESAKSAPRQGSIEDWARRKRFDFLIRLCKRHRAQAIALAHTRDDLTETVLMRLLRGAGLLGLRGILLERQINGTTVIRPLLSMRKTEVLQYLENEKLSFCTDHTNFKTDFFRNKVRLKLLPLLEKEYSPNITQVLLNLSDSVSFDYDFINQAAATLFSRIAKAGTGSVRLNSKGLSGAHPALRRMVFRMAFEYLRGDLKRFTLEHIRELEDLLANRPNGSVVDLPGLRVAKSKAFLELKRQ